VADGDLAYLSSLSEHPNRPGDVSNFNPDFASRLAASLRQARAAGLPLGVMSGYRDPGQTGSAYDAGGNSSHTYGLASDISGLDGPNGKITNQWAQIAQANGLHNPYGVDNTAEFNHWQLPAQPLEQTPQLLASLKAAKATGNFQNVWNAYSGGGSTTPNVDARIAGSSAAPYSFSLPANAPMGMGNNNPLNIKYVAGAPYAGLIGPSKNTDQGDPQMVFSSPEAGWSAAYSLLGRKYGSGMTTPNAIIAGKGGWTPGNTAAAANVAKAAGIGPDDDIGFNDPLKAQKFMRALVTQEQGAAGAAYPDAMIAGAVSGNFTPGGQASGPIDPSIIARGGYSPAIPGTTLNAPPPGTAAATPGVLPGFTTKAASDAFTQGATALDKAVHGDQSAGQQEGAGQAAAFNFPQARNVHPLLALSSQIYGNTLNSLATPLQWGSATPGQNPYAASGGAPIGQQFGTQLTSIDQMRQMMAMMGSPYASPTGT
jgi:hypothetical protein